MPAALQVATISFRLALLSSAVLAVVVTQTPRIAFGSQEGVGVTGVGEGMVPPPAEPSLFLEQFAIKKQAKINVAANCSGFLASIMCNKLRIQEQLN